MAPNCRVISEDPNASTTFQGLTRYFKILPCSSLRSIRLIASTAFPHRENLFTVQSLHKSTGTVYLVYPV